jgi:hypothetical protein
LNIFYTELKDEGHEDLPDCSILTIIELLGNERYVQISEKGNYGNFQQHVSSQKSIFVNLQG